MQGALFLVQRFAQLVQVGVVVLFGKEARLAVVPALHDVQRDSVDVDAGGGAACAKIYSRLRRKSSLARLLGPKVLIALICSAAQKAMV